MTNRAEIERLLNQTGRTLEGLPKVEIGYGSRTNGKTMSIIKHQSDVIELLVGALRDALDKKPEWISVKERLPEDNKYVLVAVKNYGYGDTYSDVAMYDGELWVRDAGSYFDIIDKGEVTHWMPLPSAPKGE